MARLPSAAGVGERTVQAVARGEVVPPKRRRRQPIPRPAPVAGEWYREPRHTELIARLRAQGVDPRCVEYRGPNEMIVWGSPEAAARMMAKRRAA